MIKSRNFAEGLCVFDRGGRVNSMEVLASRDYNISARSACITFVRCASFLTCYGLE